MKFGLLDIINVVIIFQLLAFSCFLFARRTGRLSNYILGLQLFSQAAGIFNGFCVQQSHYFYAVNPSLLFVGYPFAFLWGPTFYLYVRSTAYSNFRFKPFDIIHFTPFIAVALYLLITFLPLSNEAKRIVLSAGSYPLMRYGLYIDISLRAQVLFYIIGSLRLLSYVHRELKQSYSSISKTHVSWLDFLVIGFTSAFALTIPTMVILGYISGSHYLTSFISIIPYFIYFNIIFFKAWSNPAIFAGVEENVRYKSSRLTKEEAGRWINEINQYVSAKKPYLDPDLTVNQLSESLSMSPRILSQIINEYLNQSFYDYINGLRVEESKKMLLDSGGKKTVLEILYDVGFNTKSAYNVAFKRMTGYTPTQYRKRFSAPVPDVNETTRDM